MVKHCKIKGCPREHRRKGFCDLHWQRFKFNSPLLTSLDTTRNIKTIKKCSIIDCERDSYAKGFCQIHYDRFKRHGDPMKVIRKRGANKSLFKHKGVFLPMVKTSDGKWIKESRYVLGKHLGKTLTPKDIVHHKDGNPCNNEINNLVLTTNQEHHSKFHTEKYIRKRTFDKIPCLVCGIASQARSLCAKHRASWKRNSPTFPKHIKIPPKMNRGFVSSHEY